MDIRLPPARETDALWLCRPITPVFATALLEYTLARSTKHVHGCARRPYASRDE